MIWTLIAVMMGLLMPTRTPKCDAGDMISQLKRHEIQVLLKAGFGVADVAERSGTSVDTVRRIRKETPVEHTDNRAARTERRIGRPSKAAPFTEKISGWLKEQPDLPTQELLRRTKEAGYSGSKSALYALAAALRPPQAAPIVRFEGLPGEFSQHDFGQVDVTYVDDRPRTIVNKAGKGRDVVEFNATFAQAIVDIGVGVEMCAPRSGNQKGSVERLVGWVKSSFFKPRKFQDENDLRAQLAG